LARFAEYCLLIRRVGISIQQVYRQGTRVEQSLAQGFGVFGIGINDERQPGHLISYTVVLRTQIQF
jgi:hypothetical protein